MVSDAGEPERARSRPFGAEPRALGAEGYDAWYRTARGRWVGDAEFRLLVSLLRPDAGESLLDIGCGTGYFARRFAREAGLRVAGLDRNPVWVDFARQHGGSERYCVGRAEALPFADRSFDYALSVAALCFVADQRSAVREMLRVARKRFAVGLLNRRSVLYLRKGLGGGAGAYRGAHWHTYREIRALLEGLPVGRVAIRTAIVLPGAGALVRGIERLAPRRLPLGGFIAVAGDVVT